ncbi:MAG: universal stress protein UspA [Paenibacillus sp.]|jgi:nucleotide-binding universal stress UspA family protein|nr:universal stress protein UspA [Paenibacillus sp.]
MLFQHVVVAYDGSNQSQKALDQAAAIVSQNPGARLSIVHVYHLPNFVVGEALVVAPVEVDMEAMAEAERILDEAKARVAALGNIGSELLQGTPTTAILEYAERVQADLIVIGSRGLGTFKELLLGSVSHYIVQHAKIAVLVTK